MHERISRFVTENAPLVIGALKGALILEGIPFSVAHFDVSYLNDAFLLLVVGEHTAQKNTILHTNNTFLINHNLKFPLDGANMTTEMRIINGNLLTIENHKTIKRYEISKCEKYLTCAVCIAIGDVLCGWNAQISKCSEISDEKNVEIIQNLQTPGHAINQICQVHVDQPIGFTRKRNEPVTIATKTDNIPIFESLTWRTPGGDIIDKNNQKYFHSYQAELDRAQLVVYPNMDNPAKMDGTYKP